MKKYFDLVLDLLELENREKLGTVADFLEDENNKGKDVFYATRYDFLFKAWTDFLNWVINEEEFVQIWDTESKRPLYQKDKILLKDFLQNLKGWELPEEEILLIDQDGWNFFLTEEEKKAITDVIAKNGKIICFVW